MRRVGGPGTVTDAARQRTSRRYTPLSMEGSVPPAPAGSVPSRERPRHGPDRPPNAVRIAGARASGASTGWDAVGSGAVATLAETAISAASPACAAEVAEAHVLAFDAQNGHPQNGHPEIGHPENGHPENGHAQNGIAGNGGGAVAGRVLVLNATFEPINVCSIRRAVVLLLKDKAEVVERGVRSLHAETFMLARPVVIRLVAYVRVPHRAHRRKITRRAVFARDGWACQYCGSRSNLTVDHVVPRSKGGESSWENIVASCGPCNRRKGDRLPAQVGMELRRAPRTPRAEIFIHVSSPSIPTAWRPYLPLAA
jgi:5-methylcytosine-specific restriction endonuclease McrA